MPREKLVRPNFLIGLGISAGTDRAAAAHNHENYALVDATRVHRAVGLGVLVGARLPLQFSSTASPEESQSPQASTGSKSAAHGSLLGAFGARLLARGIYESTVKAVLEAHFGPHNSLVIYQPSESHIETDSERARPRHIGPSEARSRQFALAYQAPPFIRVPHCSAYLRHVVGCTAQRAGPGAAPN